MSEFKEGQRVKVELEGVMGNVDDKGVYVTVPVSKTYAHWIWLEHAEITLLDPPDWPPQVGDIWTTKDGEKPVKEWFARHNRSDSRQIVMTAEDGKVFFDLEPFKTLNPVLVRRRGE
jgi:hypothetical protein